MESYDVIIIGKGPAGISASLYTQRGGLRTLVIGGDFGGLWKTHSIENYYGFEHPISGRDLLETGVRQAGRLGVTLLDGEVTGIEYGNMYTVKTPGGEFATPAVLIATGQPARRPDIPGIREFEGKGVSYCTTCDGFFFRSKKVGVLGGGRYALEEAGELKPFTADITLYTNGETVGFDEKAAQADGFRVCDSKVRALHGDSLLEKIELADTSEPLDGLFVASGTASSVDFAVKLGVAVKDGSIVVDGRQATNLPGIYAAGDCTGGFRQVATAVGQGAVAGRHIIEFVRQQKKTTGKA